MSRSDHHACGRNCIVCFYEPARNKRADAAAEADERELPAELEALERDSYAPDGYGFSESPDIESLPAGVTVELADPEPDDTDDMVDDHWDCEQCTGYSSRDDELPNPVRGEWWNDGDEPLPDSPCWGCRRGLRRAHVIDPDTNVILQHHLVREGVTVDCDGLNYRMQQLLTGACEVTREHIDRESAYDCCDTCGPDYDAEHPPTYGAPRCRHGTHECTNERHFTDEET